MKSISQIPLFCLLLFLLIFTQHAEAQKERDPYLFKDSIDGATDLSGFLNTATGFMPVPTVITEPAVGYGGGLIGLYFHDKSGPETTRYGQLPPRMSFGGGMLTENGTWAGLIGHTGSYFKDKMRYLGVLVYTDVNMDFYRTSQLTGNEYAIGINMQGWFTLQEFMFRIHKKFPLFAGVNYSYFNNKVGLNLHSSLLPDDVEDKINDWKLQSNTGGLNAVVLYDTRSNSFTPDHGVSARLMFGRFDNIFGSDREHWTASFNTYAYTDKIADWCVAGFRFSGEGKWGDMAFYQKPYINMRGIPAMRYQDDYMGLVETEWRFNVYKRWSLLAFTGIGYVAPEIHEFTLDAGKAMGGTGFRYFIAKQYGMHCGMDIARGPEDWAWYITFGSAWPR